MSRLRLFVCVGLSAAVSLGGAVALAATPEDGSEEWTELLDQAHAQLEDESFAGEVEISWRAFDGVHTETLDVRHTDGIVEIKHDDRVVVGTPEQMVVDGRVSTTVAESSVLGVPELTPGKYEIERRDGPELLGQPTTILEARLDGAAGTELVERFYVDRDSGLVLRRDTVDGAGEVLRSFAFTALERDGDPEDLTQYADSARDDADGPHVVGHVSSPYRAPDHAGDGFRLVKRFRHDNGIVQLYYSDGLLGASVFEQPGELEWDALPEGGDDADVEGARARRYVLPIGETWVWERDGVVYTLVSDAPTAELEAVAAGVSASRQDGPAARAARLVLAPFSW